MKELVNRLNEARKAYYEGESIMSDKEYDNLYDKLVKMELTTGVVLPNSPTEEVGYTVVSNLEKVKHEQKALSLDKTKDVHFLETWLGTQDGVLSWKMDGMTVVATYENGQLIMAATRGNGEIGENVTHNARCIKGLPMKIRETGKVIVRGECILSYNDFEKIKESENGEYKNPRNLANASLRLYDSKKASTRHLQFKAFTLVECPKMPKTVEESFHWMEKQGFTVVEYKKVTAFTIKETITDYFEKEVESYTFPTDGLVLCMDDIAYGASLGVTNKFPRNSIAFKWQDDSVETTLTDVIWSPSRTGLINPVALFKPVEIEGTMVAKASLHNLSYLSLLQLGYGDTITIYKANKIIPQVDENLTMNGNYIKIPAKCPACKQAATRRFNADKSSEFLYCENPKCPAKHVGMYHAREIGNILNNLPGRKILVTGNHDFKNIHSSSYKKTFAKITSYLEIEDNGRNVVLFHYPIEDWNGKYRGYYHLHGHVHNNGDSLSKKDRRYNVSAEIVDYTPISIDELEQK